MSASHTTIEDQIETILTRELNPVELMIINESQKHAGHTGDNGTGQTHFKLQVVSEAFDGKSRIQQHRLVNDALKPLFNNGLHALQLECRIP